MRHSSLEPQGSYHAHYTSEKTPKPNYMNKQALPSLPSVVFLLGVTVSLQTIIRVITK